MINRNLILLFLCQLISATGTIVMVTLGGIIGAALSPDPAWATLPVSLWVLTLAASAIPAALLMRRIGRPFGFALGAVSAAAAVLIAVWALRNESFVMFLAAAAMFGINMAFTQQYRFAAVESTAPRFAARAVSLILIGSIGGALLGPAILTRTASESSYEVTLLSVAVLYMVSAATALFLRRAHTDVGKVDDAAPRPLAVIARQPVFIVAVVGAMAGYGVMVFLMTATPLSMHNVDGFTLRETSAVIRAHVLGMYLPSFVSGYLIDRFGVVKIMSLGALTLLISLGIGMSGQAYSHYWGALVLLGVGWNFLFVGGTTMLTYSYTAAERFRAQALNEFCVFGTAAAGSLLAGTIMYGYGWFATVAVPAPILLIVLGGLVVVGRGPLTMQVRVGDLMSTAESDRPG